MKLPVPFIKLPIQFDVEKLRADLEAISDDAWRGHNTGFAGNTACLLVTPYDGDPEGFFGQLEPTADLKGAAYFQTVLKSFQTVVGRTRLMRLSPGAAVPRHTDVNYYWRHRIRVHVPIQTQPEVLFTSGKDSIHMAAGEAWVFDNWRQHTVENGSTQDRIHLVFDTVGTAAFWRLVSGDASVANGQSNWPLLFESTSRASLLSHYAVDQEMQFLNSEMTPADQKPETLQTFQQAQRILHDFTKEWRALSLMRDPVFYARTGHGPLLQEFTGIVRQLPDGHVHCSNGTSLVSTLMNYLEALGDALDAQSKAAAA
ncbi:MAG: aspartyl/asparaginyl beta-hydroxylase domain-containing protein [Pseudomonadota bacterium]